MIKLSKKLFIFIASLILISAGFLFSLQTADTEKITFKNANDGGNHFAEEIANGEEDNNETEKDQNDNEQEAIKKFEDANTETVSKNSVADDDAEIANKTKNAEDIKITDKKVSWGFAGASGRKIDTIIIHSSYDAFGEDPYDLSGLINEYKTYGVSPHYLITRAGKIYRLISDENIAYHAGQSQAPDGRTNVNNFSLGIELMNTKESKFSDEQYDALNELIAYLKKRYSIKYVLGHSQIAPGRKDDPWNFDYSRIKL